MVPLAPPTNIPGVSHHTVRALQLLFHFLTWINPRLAARAALMLFVVPGTQRVTCMQRAVLERAHIDSLAFEGGHLRIYRWGSAGPAVLLAHGWSSRAARLTGFVVPLLKAGYRVIAFDAPAHGSSSGLYADMKRYQRAMSCVRQKLGPVRAVIAHSFGARAAMLLLSRGHDPEMRAAVLIGTPPHVRYMFEQFKLALALRPDVQKLLDASFARAFGKLPEAHAIGYGAAEPQCPILLVHDVDDEVAPFMHARHLANRFARGTLMATRELMHCGALDDLATIHDIVRFMKSQHL